MQQLLSSLSAQSTAFYIGAALILVFQANKFNAINLGIPEYAHYREWLSGLGTRDLSSIISYWIGLGAFCFVSVMVYAFFCELSPTITTGLLKIVHSDISPDPAIPYPLYIAAIFLGLTQPALPGLALFTESQRDFFHARIHVPERIISQVEVIMAQLQAPPQGRDGLTRGLLQLLDPGWEVQSREFFDASFFNFRVEPLELPPFEHGELEAYLKSLPDRALRSLAKNVILSALISAMRKSGVPGAQRLFDRLGVPWETYPPIRIGSALISAMSFFALMTIVLLLLMALREPVQALLRVAHGSWGESFDYVRSDVTDSAGGFLLALAAGLSVWTRGAATIDPPQGGGGLMASLKEYGASLRQYPGAVVIAFLFAFAWEIAFNLHVIGSSSGSLDLWDVVIVLGAKALMPLPTVVTVITATRHGPGPTERHLPLWWGIGAAAIGTALISLLYSLLIIDIFGGAADLPVYSVLMNVAVAAGAYVSIALLLERPGETA